jgi:WD40 repeat protein
MKNNVFILLVLSSHIIFSAHEEKQQMVPLLKTQSEIFTPDLRQASPQIADSNRAATQQLATAFESTNLLRSLQQLVLQYLNDWEAAQVLELQKMIDEEVEDSEEPWEIVSCEFSDDQKLHVKINYGDKEEGDQFLACHFIWAPDSKNKFTLERSCVKPGRYKKAVKSVLSGNYKARASLSNNSSIEILRLNDNNEFASVQMISGHMGAVTSLMFSSCGNYLASGSLDSTIKIWIRNRNEASQKADQFELFQGLTGHKGAVNMIAFSPDGTYLVSGSGDKTIKIWRTQAIAIQNADDTDLRPKSKTCCTIL